MIFNAVPIKDETYNVSLDDHCLVVESGIGKDNKKVWLSKKMCKWIATNYKKINFKKDNFGKLKFYGAHNEV